MLKVLTWMLVLLPQIDWHYINIDSGDGRGQTITTINYGLAQWRIYASLKTDILPNLSIYFNTAHIGQGNYRMKWKNKRNDMPQTCYPWGISPENNNRNIITFSGHVTFNIRFRPRQNGRHFQTTFLYNIFNVEPIVHMWVYQRCPKTIEICRNWLSWV